MLSSSEKNSLALYLKLCHGMKPNKPDPQQTARGSAAMWPAFWQHPGALGAPKHYELEETDAQEGSQSDKWKMLKAKMVNFQQ